jgi:hypothetical protein
VFALDNPIFEDIPIFGSDPGSGGGGGDSGGGDSGGG